VEGRRGDIKARTRGGICSTAPCCGQSRKTARQGAHRKKESKKKRGVEIYKEVNPRPLCGARSFRSTGERTKLYRPPIKDTTKSSLTLRERGGEAACFHREQPLELYPLHLRRKWGGAGGDLGWLGAERRNCVPFFGEDTTNTALREVQSITGGKIVTRGESGDQAWS